MFEGYEKNHITSSDDSSLSVDTEGAGVSVNDMRITLSVEVNEPGRANDYTKIRKGNYFLICDSCLWNASYFDSELTYVKCPVCSKGKIKCMPIGDDERNSYSFNHSYNIGIELVCSKNMRS